MKYSKVLILTIVSLAISLNVAAQKRSLSQSDYDSWKRIDGISITDNGKWVSYGINPQVGDGNLFFYNTATKNKTQVALGSSATFFSNGNWALIKVKVPFDSLRKAKIDKVKPDKMPKDTYRIYRLNDMSTSDIKDIKSIVVSGNNSLVAYTHEVTMPKTANKKEQKFDRLIIADVEKGDTIKVDRVKSYKISKDGNMICYTTESDSLKNVFVNFIAPGRDTNRQTKQLWSSSKGQIMTPTIDDAGNQMAFLATTDTTKWAQYDLYYFDNKSKELKRINSEAVISLPAGYTISGAWNVRFFNDDNYLQFGTGPKPVEIPKDTMPADEKFSLDIWSWNDILVVPQQVANAKRRTGDAYSAVYYPKTGRAVALADKQLERIIFADNNDAHYALGYTSLPYALHTDPQSALFTGVDAYLIEIAIGKRTKILTKSSISPQISPSGKYVLYYNHEDNSYYTINTKTLVHSLISGGIPHPLYDEENDYPRLPSPYGGSWTRNDDKILIYDRYDIWLADLSGKDAAVNLTKIGRETNTQFRLAELPDKGDKKSVDLSEKQVLTSFNFTTKENGIYAFENGSGVSKCMEGGYKYIIVDMAKDSGEMIYRRQNIDEYPDLWISNSAFDNGQKITEANHQKSEFNWGSVQLIKWNGNDGNECEGQLLLPDNYDASKKYPMIVYFYEAQTDNMFRYHIPGPSRSIINPIYCTSNGYVVFIPDVRYKVGYPGQSCYDIVVSGTQSLIAKGIADPKRIGLQGQSWGGYQNLYLVTHTNLFTCSAPGAAVSNMVSGFGSIYGSTGNPRQYLYENFQSRIGATPWMRRDLYIENSPIFYADKVNTPLLLRHSDTDGAVPFGQGLEFFIAMRRLGKTAWLLNYNNEEHNLVGRAASMDWDKRMYQFFDYYLKDAPMPRWMKEGISVKEKGVDLKLDY